MSIARRRFACVSAVLGISAACMGGGWFATGQDAELMLSGAGFNQTGGGLQFNHPSGLASDGTRLAVCDRFNNRVLIWNKAPDRWDALPDVVLGQQSLDTNDPGDGRNGLNWPGNASLAQNGTLAVADTENDRILVWGAVPTRNGEPASIVLHLPSFTEPGARMRYEWPWGVWTDGTRLAAVATHGSAVLFWNELPSRDNQPPDYVLRLPQFGTPRNISTDGATYFFVGDHNARVGRGQPGTFFWKRYPKRADEPYDFAFGEWLKGTGTPGGGLVAGGLGSVYVWDKFPTSATDQPSTIVRHRQYSNGDGPDCVWAGGRLYVNNYNGNNVHVYGGVPQRGDEAPAFALGSESVTTNTLSRVHYIQNPVVATDGRALVVTSDFDAVLWLWRRLPVESSAPPDVRVNLRELRLSPWDNALHGGRLVVAGKESVGIWNSLPMNGEKPSRVFHGQIGGVRLQELKGVALDERGLYLGDRNGNLMVWSGLPETGQESPRVVVPVGEGLNHLHSDGTYLCAGLQSNPARLVIYRVADLHGSPEAARPYKVVQRTRELPLNLPAGGITFGGSLALANTSGNSVYVWRDIADAGDPARAVVLGQQSVQSTDAGIGRNRLFMPASLAYDGSGLWVGELKFSSRILRYLPTGTEVPGQ